MSNCLLCTSLTLYDHTIVLIYWLEDISPLLSFTILYGKKWRRASWKTWQKTSIISNTGNRRIESKKGNSRFLAWKKKLKKWASNHKWIKKGGMHICERKQIAGLVRIELKPLTSPCGQQIIRKRPEECGDHTICIRSLLHIGKSYTSRVTGSLHENHWGERGKKWPYCKSYTRRTTLNDHDV